jgi:hypothetical protein
MLRLIPLWLPWPDEDTLKFGDQYLQRLKKDVSVKYRYRKPIIFGRQFALGPDIAGISEWKLMLEKNFPEANIDYRGALTDRNHRSNWLHSFEQGYYNAVLIPKFITSLTKKGRAYDRKSKIKTDIRDMYNVCKRLDFPFEYHKH